MKRSFALVIVLAAAVLGAAAGCGGEERLSREEFSERLQTIHQRGGELWGRLAEQAQDLEPDDPLPAGVEQALQDLIEFQREAVAELEAITPPEATEEPVELLIAALRARTEVFEAVVPAGHFTRHDLDEVAAAGEKIDAAFAQLRARGISPPADEH